LTNRRAVPFERLLTQLKTKQTKGNKQFVRKTVTEAIWLEASPKREAKNPNVFKRDAGAILHVHIDEGIGLFLCLGFS
jgi:hypothetical protein